MSSLLQASALPDGLEVGYRTWLSGFDPVHLANWEKLRGADYESAMAKAVAKRMLAEYHRVKLIPYASPAGLRRRPDFLCMADDASFFVDVACIPIDTATSETGLPYAPQRWSGGWQPLADVVWAHVVGAADQYEDLPHPVLIAIGTFHGLAATLSFSKQMVELLVRGKLRMSWDINSVSGLLLSDLEKNPPRTCGVLLPNPARPFDATCLPRISFCEVARGEHGLSTCWIPETEITLIDRGRGLQLSTSRITVQDLVPYFRDGAAQEEICRALPTLSAQEIQTVERYYREHKEELLEEDRRIREETSRRKNPEWVDRVAAESRAERAAIQEKLSRLRANGEPL